MIKLQAKRFELNFLLKLSDLKSNFTLTLDYLNPALNNPGQVINSLTSPSASAEICSKFIAADCDHNFTV